MHKSCTVCIQQIMNWHSWVQVARICQIPSLCLLVWSPGKHSLAAQCWHLFMLPQWGVVVNKHHFPIDKYYLLTNSLVTVLVLSKQNLFCWASALNVCCFPWSLDWGTKARALPGLLCRNHQRSELWEHWNHWGQDWKLLPSIKPSDCILWKQDTVMQGKYLTF